MACVSEMEGKNANTVNNMDIACLTSPSNEA